MNVRGKQYPIIAMDHQKWDGVFGLHFSSYLPTEYEKRSGLDVAVVYPIFPYRGTGKG
jgi:hypothetical protein